MHGSGNGDQEVRRHEGEQLHSMPCEVHLPVHGERQEVRRADLQGYAESRLRRVHNPMRNRLELAALTSTALAGMVILLVACTAAGQTDPKSESSVKEVRTHFRLQSA